VHLTRTTSIAATIVAAALLASCGGGGVGGGTSRPIPATTPTPSSSASGITALTGLAAAPLAVGDTRAFTPSESGYSGGYTVTSSAPSVASVTPSSGTGPFTVKGLAPGTTTITTSDTNGHSSSVPLTVSATVGFGSLTATPANTQLTTGETTQFTPSEPGYSGTYTATSSNPAVITVSPASGTGPFTLTAVSPGTATITVADQNGHSASTTLTVTAPGSTPAPTNAPSGTPTTAPSGSPTTAPSGNPTTAPSSSPTSTPTSAPISLTPVALTVDLNQLANVAETDSTGATPTTSVANPATATIVSTGSGQYEVVGNQAGNTTITFSDPSGNTTTLPVTVPASPQPVIQLNPTGVNDGAAGLGATAVTLSPTETGYTGPFTASSSNASVASVSQVGNTFVVATANPGSVIITVRDDQGNSASIGFTVQ